MLVPFTTLPLEMKQCTLLNQGSFSWENDNRTVAVGTYSNPGWLNKTDLKQKMAGYLVKTRTLLY
jgi:hypothetical protein